jgi:flagellar biosynthesis protein FliQ
MNAHTVVDLLRQALLATFWISLPILTIGLLAGIVMSLVQIVTSMQDTAVATVPRLAAFLAGLLFLLPWMLSRMTSYTAVLFGDLSRYAR